MPKTSGSAALAAQAMTTGADSTWNLTGATVRGAIHVRRGAPNQDAIVWHPATRTSEACVLVLADGHGAPAYFRSHRGARMAVRSATGVLTNFAQQLSNGSVAEIEQRVLDTLARELTQKWRSEVAVDIAKRPISKWELTTASDQASPSFMDRLASDPKLAYGSTLVAAVLSPEYLLYVQLGDGDIVEVTADDAARAPMPVDPLVHGNMTTSLCSADAWRHVRVLLQTPVPDEIQGVMLSTDGYANSFESNSGLLQAAVDLCSLSREMGVLDLARALPGWLRATSAQGSGDDISVGLATRTF